MSNSVSLEYLNSVLPTSSSGTGISTDGGIYITLVNGTGAASVKGTVVTASPTTNNACSIVPAATDKPIGVIIEDGVANGSPVKVAVSGKAYVLLEDFSSSTRGYWAGVSTIQAGRIIARIDPESSTVHWRECGHCLESITAGTNKLCLCVIHFN